MMVTPSKSRASISEIRWRSPADLVRPRAGLVGEPAPSSSPSCRTVLRSPCSSAFMKMRYADVGVVTSAAPAASPPRPVTTVVVAHEP